MAQPMPQGYMPQGYMPQGYMPQGQVVQGHTVDMPQGHVQQGYIPQGHVPMHNVPNPQFVPGMPVQNKYVGPGMQQMETGQGDFDGRSVAHVPAHIRADFVKKVYTILSVQLALTFCIAYYMHDNLTPLWVSQNRSLYNFISFGTLGFLLAVRCCCANVMRTFPINFVFLGIVTIGLATTTGFITVLYTTSSVLLALGVTAGVFLALTAYACFTQTDFTGLGPYLYAALIAMMLFGFGLMLMGYFAGGSTAMTTMHKVYAGLGVLLFVFYIIYDTQLIVGGQHKQHEFSIDDYVYAALMLYLDILNLFMYLLELMGDRR